MTNTTKERPLIFTGPMVRTLLDRSKTQTRRIVKLPHQNPLGQWEPTTFGGKDGGRTAAGATIPEQAAIWHTRTGECFTCPHGQPGDRIWVREKHRPIWGQTPGYLTGVDYHADPREKWERLGDQIGMPTKWVASIHMMRQYSRILLEVVGVRIERLHDISREDAVAEGVERVENNYGNGPAYCDYRMKDQSDTAEWFNSPVDSYRTLWESINGARTWDANPWVWVIEFRHVDQGTTTTDATTDKSEN